MRYLILAILALVTSCGETSETQEEASTVKASDAKIMEGVPLTTDKSVALTAGEWLIIDIAGDGVINKSQASLIFSKEGQLAANASCNRLIGSYNIDRNSLTIELMGTTMMLCPDPVQSQERKLLDMLALVNRYMIDKTGTLVLTTADDLTITARLM
ncbi:MAG: META domain-containing protein [Spongiibacteraceae bacterium]